MKYTIFPNVSAQSFSSQEGDFKDIAELIRNAEAQPEKKQGRLLKLATFGDIKTNHGCLRNNENVTSVTGLEFDYDKEQIPIQIGAKIAKKLGMECVLYPSFRNTSETPRWRLLLPLSTPVLGKDRLAWANKVNKVFGEIFADESFRESQSYYYQPPKEANSVIYLQGEAFDKISDSDILETTNYGRKLTRAAILASEDAKKTITDQTSSRHNAIHHLGCALGRSKIPEEMVEDALKCFESMMRKTDSSGKETPMNYQKELSNIHAGYQKGLEDKKSSATEAVDYSEVDELIESHCKILLGEIMMIGYRYYDEKADRYISKFIKESAFHSFNAEKKATIKTANDYKQVPATKMFMQDRRTKKYNQVTFSVKPCGEHVYNRFQGFAYTPNTESLWKHVRKCRKLLWHIKYIICSGNKENFRYFMAWTADTLTDTANKKGVAVVLHGEKGSGKSIAAEVIMGMHGEHGLLASQASQVVGQFNAHLAECTFLLAEEAVWVGNKPAEDIIKTIITSSTAMTEGKGKGIVTTPNLVHVMHLTNHEHCVPASTDERRYFVMRCSSAKLRDYDYFRALSEEIENGGREALFNVLVRSNWKTEVRNPPNTEELTNQKIQSLDSISSFIYNCLDDGRIVMLEGGCRSVFKWADDAADADNFISRYELHQAYAQFCTTYKFYKPEQPKAFASKVNRIFNHELKVTKDSSGNNGYRLKNLQKYKDLFSKYVGGDVLFTNTSETEFPDSQG